MIRFAYPSLILSTLLLAACGGGDSGAPENVTSVSGNAQVAGSSGAVQSSSGTGSGSNTSASETTISATHGTTGGASAGSAPAASTTTAQPSSGSGAAGTSSSPPASGSSGSASNATPAPAASGSTPASASGSTPAPAASGSTPASSTTTSTTPQIIEYYGDSTIWGYRSGAGDQVKTPAPLAFAQALPKPSAYTVKNEGVSGTTACQLLNGTDGVHQKWSAQMAASKASYVLVNHAINDEWKYDLNTYKSCLRSLAQTAKQYGKQMIFETPNPTRDSGSAGLDVYVNAMKQVASEQSVPVIDQYAYLTKYLNGQSPYTICPDGLHPTQDVYIMKGKYAAGAFATLFIK